jgi:hypothetical protein
MTILVFGLFPTAPAAEAMIYRRLYEVMPDPYDGDYTMLLAPFGPKSQQALADLRDSIFATNRSTPHVFLYLTEDAGVPVMCTLHYPMQYAASLGIITPWDNHRVAFTTDISSGIITTMGWPASAFNRTAAIQVPTIANMDGALTATAGADCADPFIDGDPDVEEIRTHFLMLVPPIYAHVMLGRSIPLRDLWNKLGTMIINDGHQAACAPLLNWLRVSVTYCPAAAAGGQPENLASLLADDLVPPLADDQLNSQIYEWI